VTESRQVSPVSPSGPADGQQRDAAVDVQKLADKVYELMLAELRLEWARNGGALQRARR